MTIPEQISAIDDQIEGYLLEQHICRNGPIGLYNYFNGLICDLKAKRAELEKEMQDASKI